MVSNGNILIVDDEEQLRKLLSRLIALDRFTVYEATDLKAALHMLNTKPVEVILCDVKLPDGNGVDFVSAVKKQFPSIEIVLLTAYGNIADGVRAIKNGAFDYLQKGDENARIIPLLYQAVEKFRQQAHTAIKVNTNKTAGFSSIIGHSRTIQAAIEQAKKIAQTDASILLLGETGTGKEVFANAIHHESKRAHQPMVAINCSAFSRELLEGELFGHRSDAYTGANKDKRGLVEVANNGTLFLDEIGEMPLELQAKLLRFLENGEFIKLGDTKVSKVDVRIIAATNKNLFNEISNGNFREDLYYRLNVFNIELPALKDRREDIPELALSFLHRFKNGVTISKEAVQILTKYNWPGNIRELENIIEQSVVMNDGRSPLSLKRPLSGNSLPQTSSSSIKSLNDFKSVQKQSEIDYLSSILQKTRGRIRGKGGAAELLNQKPTTLESRLQKLGIRKDDFSG